MPDVATDDRRQPERRRNAPKFRCPSCNHGISTVVADSQAGADVRNGHDIYRRTRRCDRRSGGCGTVYATIEALETLMVLHSPQRIQK
jgi:transcriptional regulator NrdR family protein